MRVTGSGNLDLYLNSLDTSSHTTQLTSVAMQSTTNREPVILSNFIDQRAQLEGKTTVINDTFTISRIYVFIKPVAEGYPQ